MDIIIINIRKRTLRSYSTALILQMRKVNTRKCLLVSAVSLVWELEGKWALNTLSL